MLMLLLLLSLLAPSRE
jgi:hypothetical protein